MCGEWLGHIRKCRLIDTQVACRASVHAWQGHERMIVVQVRQQNLVDLFGRIQRSPIPGALRKDVTISPEIWSAPPSSVFLFVWKLVVIRK